jgi:site-specific DNA-methyltransferase (adenine-specific)
MKWNQVFTIDAMEGVRGLPDESVRTVVTSPPYFRQRDYGVPGNGGKKKRRMNMWGTWSLCLRS